MKNKYPVISFWIMCFITTFLLLHKLYYIVGTVIQLVIWDSFSWMIVSFLAPSVIMAILIGTLLVAFTIKMGKKEKIGSGLLGFALVTALIEFVFVLWYYAALKEPIPLYSKLLWISFLLFLLLLVLEKRRNISKKKILVLFVCIVLLTPFFFYDYFRETAPLIIYSYSVYPLKGIQFFYVYTLCYVLPIFEVIAFFLVSVYTLFYEKFFRKKVRKTYCKQKSEYRICGIREYILTKKKS